MTSAAAWKVLERIADHFKAADKYVLGAASWLWLVLFFVILTLGELFILPMGLGLFARLAPSSLGATTVAAWFSAIFSGSMLAGVVGTLWSRASHSVSSSY